MALSTLAKTRNNHSGLLFLRRWLANPQKVGTMIPSGPHISRLMARHARRNKDQAVIEVGAGTGPVTQALFDTGLPIDRLFVVEIDPALCRHLHARFPKAQVIEGDCMRLADCIPEEWHGKIGSIVSGIPMVLLPYQTQKAMMDAFFSVMAPGGRVVQITYKWAAPFPAHRMGYKGRRAGVTWKNVPPAFVWVYEKA